MIHLIFESTYVKHLFYDSLIQHKKYSIIFLKLFTLHIIFVKNKKFGLYEY